MHELRVDQPYVVERRSRPQFALPSSRRALATAEISFVFVSLAAAFSFTRIFDSFAFVVPVTVTTLVGHAFGAMLRRRRIRSLAALPLTVMAVALTSAAFSLRPTIRADLADAWWSFNNARSPVPPTRAFVLAASLVIGLAVVAADWLAFRRRALFGALLPALVVFGFTAMFGDHRHRFVSIVLLAMTSVCFALAHRLAFFDRGNGWMVNRTLSQRRFVMSGLAVSSCAVLIALAIGPSLPGASNEALVSWRDIGNGWAQQQDGVALAPLVSVRAQLVDPSDTEVFTVQAAQSDYWRLTALDVFDGVEWTARTKDTAAVTLPTTATDAAREVVTIKALRGNWLPTPFAPVAVQLKGNTAVFDPGSATLVSADRLGKGDTYVVWSSATDAAVSAPTSDDVSIPRAVRQRLSSLVNQIVRNAGAVTVTQKAQALEAYFLDNFTYDLNVAAGSSITDISTFLQRRAGYCEQFAATFAAMARVLGIPSRVAIGYRGGTYDAAKNEYHVTGNDAHAWPEVYITGQGWVRFEPTPPTAGSSAASAAAGDSAGDGAASATPAAASADAPSTTVPAAADPSVDPSPSDGTAPVTHASDRHVLVSVAALLVALALSAPVVVDRVRSRRGRRRVRHDPRGQIAWLWRDALHWLRIAGVDAHPTDTPLEVARRAVPLLPNASSPIVALAELVTAAWFAEAVPDAEEIDAARRDVERIEQCAKAQLCKRWRLRSYAAHVVAMVSPAGARRSPTPPPSRVPITDW